MNAIEQDFEPLLNQLPKDYDKFENNFLEDLLRFSTGKFCAAPAAMSSGGSTNTF